MGGRLVNGFTVGDKCRIKVDWADTAGAYCKIVRFQKNGTETFAKVRWLGKKSIELENKLGVLFNVQNELVKV